MSKQPSRVYIYPGERTQYSETEVKAILRVCRMLNPSPSKVTAKQLGLEVKK